MVTPLLGQLKFDEAREVLALVKKPYLLESAWFKNIVGKAEAEINLAAGELEAASLWAREAGLDYRDKVLQTNRTTYRVYARVLMAEERYSEAAHLLNQMIRDSENTGAYAYLNSLLPMQCIVQLHLGNQEQAVTILQRALNMAAEGGYVREYIRQGKPMAKLLRIAIKQNIQPEYAAKLLEEIGKDQTLQEDLDKSAGKIPTDEGGLIEPLSNRELEVLYLIAEGCSNKEIAQQLIVSLYTVKSHARNIFSKLGVKNRTEAVAKARFYGLMPEK